MPLPLAKPSRELWNAGKWCDLDSTCRALAGSIQRIGWKAMTTDHDDARRSEIERGVRWLGAVIAACLAVLVGTHFQLTSDRLLGLVLP
jgi:hypothetical protein